MIRYKEILTCKFLGITKKEPIGKILDVAYSDDYRRVTHLVVKNDNLIKNKGHIPLKDIMFLKEGQILYLKDEKDLNKVLDDRLIEGFNFMDKEIRTEDGDCIGYVRDVVINKRDGSIEGFIITEGIFEDLLRGRNYIPFFDSMDLSEDCICIPNYLSSIIDKINN